MKKFFFFAAAMMAAISLNAQIYDWTYGVGTTTMGSSDVLVETVKVKGASVNCISLKKSMFSSGAMTNNYLEIAPYEGSFQEGDVVNVTFCINNSDANKNGVLGIYDATGVELAFEAASNTYSSEVNPTELQYAIGSEYATLRLGRKSGNTKVCITKLQVIRGGEVIAKAAKPIFSVSGGTYFDPFKVGLESSNADHIYVSVNNGIYEAYADSILIDQYDVDYTLSAYATLADALNSDTVSVSYRLKHFVARPVFNARKEYVFANVAAEEINILSPATATLGTYVLDGKDVPSISYTHLIHEERDSFMIVSVKDRENVTFRYKNGQNKKDIMKFGENYIQCDGSNYEIWVDSVKSGDTIVFVVTAKGSAPKFDVLYSTASYLNPYMPEDDTDPCFTDGLVMTASDAKIENNYSGWTDLVYIVEEGGHSRVRIKETANGYRIAKILVGAYRGDAPVEGIENNAVDTKAVKFFRNGQLIIRKNGVEYNALGTKL